MKKALSLFILLLLSSILKGQDFTASLYTSYENYKELTLNKRRIKHNQIIPLIKSLDANPKFEVKKVGESIEGRDLNLISLGDGNIDIFLWSQMHGDEPTATQAIFDILNFFDSDDFKSEKQTILANTRLHFLPMLNPDGAEVFERRNALGVDINRDALRLQSPESKVLKRVRDSVDAVFGFNLHDQSRYYNAESTPKPATISYLATAYNYEKDINEIRKRAMKAIVYMNDVIQKYAPGQVGRYSDDFEPRAFGDNIAKWGTSLILIESGGYANDREKQEIRKLNYVSMLSALYGIATKAYERIPISRYEEIPRNDRKMLDLKITNLTYQLLGNDYRLDVGIYRKEVDNSDHSHFYYDSEIVDLGDLSTFYGYETFDATGYKVVAPRIMEQTIDDYPVEDINKLEKELQKGFGYVRVTNIFVDKMESEAKINFISDTFELPDFQLRVGRNPTFFLKKEDKITHAIINGFLLDLSQPLTSQKFGNALIYR